MYKEYEVVKSRRKLSEKVNEGCRGAIVFVYSEYPRGYEVEFFDSNHETLDVLTVEEKDIERIESRFKELSRRRVTDWIKHLLKWKNQSNI